MERIISSKRKREQGFTLVELAIVMIIIGLLITGILKGQEMIANAQVTSTVAQIKGIDAATSTFKDTYSALPGDMTNAATRLAGCTAAAGCAPAGANGNGRVDIDPGAVVAAGEGVAFFLQLAAADLITGVNPTPTTPAIDIGDEVPEASISGASFRVGFTAGNPTGAQGGLAATWRAGHYLAVGSIPTVAIGGGGAGLEGLSPTQAGRIDAKLDDGLPQSGFVRAGGVGTCVAGAPVQYDGTVSQADCDVFVRIQG